MSRYFLVASLLGGKRRAAAFEMALAVVDWGKADDADDRCYNAAARVGGSKGFIDVWLVRITNPVFPWSGGRAEPEHLRKGFVGSHPA